MTNAAAPFTAGANHECQLAAAVMTLDTLLKILLMLLETSGIIAAAATATKPAIRAYSIKSCA
jgi:hypothetical protein